MDWIDPRQARKLQKTEQSESKGQKREERRKSLASQLRAALSQPLDVWGTAYGYALDRLTWPRGCSAEATFLWSCCTDEQAAILQRCRISEHTLVGAGSVSDVEIKSSQRIDSSSTDLSGWLDLPIEDCATDWLEGLESDAASALGVAALMWNIPIHTSTSFGSWSIQWLQEVANKIGQSSTSDEDAAICHLVTQCELPLLLGTVTGASKRAIFAGVEEAMDDLALLLEQAEEQPAIWLAYGASFLRTALASVLRCRVLASGLGLRAWYPPQKKALAELIVHAVRLCRPDGSQMLTAVAESAQSANVWDALFKQTRKPKSLKGSIELAGLGHKKANRKQLKRKLKLKQLPDLSIYSEEARSASMLCDWRQRGGRAAIDYSDSTIRLEVLGPKGQSLLVGDWSADVQLDGQSLVQLDDWERVCWFSDDDVDYLEIEAEFGEASRVQRQIVLFRKDRLLLLADALLCDYPGNWSLTTSIPIADAIEFHRTEKNNEVFLRLSQTDELSHAQEALVLPLGMPEWRRQFSQTELKLRDGLLSLQSQTQLSRLYSPLLISLAGSHAKKPFTWRRLTVAEDLAVVAADVAAAYRAQIGTDQWLLYRTLARPTRRTALGMHTGAEFLAARFCGADAEIETLVEVESDPS